MKRIDYYKKWLSVTLKGPSLGYNILTSMAFLASGFNTLIWPKWKIEMSATFFKMFFAMLVVLFFGGAINASFELYRKKKHKHDEDREQWEKQRDEEKEKWEEEKIELTNASLEYFYKHNPDVLLDKVHRIFYYLYRHGTSIRNDDELSDSVSIEKWDTGVRKALIKHCDRGAGLNLYLQNTGRSTHDGPPRPHEFEQAKDIIREWLDCSDDFKRVLKYD